MDQQGYFSRVVSLWMERIRSSQDHKNEKFGKQADESLRFYNGPHDFQYDCESEGGSLATGTNVPKPYFKMTANKVAEVVAIYLPVLYHRNPTRVVTPIENQLSDFLRSQVPFDPNQEARLRVRSDLLNCYLNKTPLMTDLMGSSRQAILEAIIKGRGIVWPGLIEGPGYLVAGSEYDTVDHLFIDPDAEQLRHAGWCARRRIGRRREVEAEFGLPRGSIAANAGASSDQQAKEAVTQDSKHGRRRDGNDDLITYYEIYSRIGIGTRKPSPNVEPVDQVDEFWDSIGQNVYLVIAEGVDFPLNLPPEEIMSLPEQEAIDQIMARTNWPTPFYENASHPWPFAPLDFREVPRSVWPMSHVYPAIGYQMFLNWAYSFLASKVARTGRDIMAVPTSCKEEFEKQLRSGEDLVVVHRDVGHAGQTGEDVKVIQFPPMNSDFRQVVAMAEANWDKAVGVNELMMGNTDTQMRSAEEAAVRDKNTSIRPDDMANRVEDWQSLIAFMEAVVARTHLGPRDIAVAFNEQYSEPDPEMELIDGQAPFPIMGPCTQLWMDNVHSENVAEIVNEFQYRIESGSARKPNKAAQQATANQAAQIMMPTLIEIYKMTGDPTEVNKLLRQMGRAQDWTEMIQFPDMRQQVMLQQQQAAQQQAMMEGPQQPGGGPPQAAA